MTSRFGDCVQPAGNYRAEGLARIRDKRDQQRQLSDDIQKWLDSGHTIELIRNRQRPGRARRCFYDDFDLMEVFQWGR